MRKWILTILAAGVVAAGLAVAAPAPPASAHGIDCTVTAEHPKWGTRGSSIRGYASFRCTDAPDLYSASIQLQVYKGGGKWANAGAAVVKNYPTKYQRFWDAYACPSKKTLRVFRTHARLDAFHGNRWVWNKYSTGPNFRVVC